MLVYVANPIDQAAGSKRYDDLVRQAALEYPGLITFHPERAFSVTPGTAPEASIEAVNRAALDEAHGLVAVLPAGVPTIGVPREIEAAVTAGKPVAVVTDIRSSFSLADLPRFTLDHAGAVEAFEYVMSEPPETVPYDLQWHVGPGGRMPSRAHATDAGFDLHVSHDVTVASGHFVDVQTDVRVAMPPSLWGRIVGRSSTLRRRGLLVVEAVIDPGYRGPIYTGVQNLSNQAVVIKAGERLAQFIPHINVAGMVTCEQVDEAAFEAIPHDGRGANGFGSSGH